MRGALEFDRKALADIAALPRTERAVYDAILDDLALRAQNGDALARSALLPLCLRPVAIRARGRFANPADAEEFVQEVGLKVVDGLHNFNGKGFAGWVHGVARNTFADWWEKVKRRTEGESERQSHPTACEGEVSEFSRTSATRVPARVEAALELSEALEAMHATDDDIRSLLGQQDEQGDQPRAGRCMPRSARLRKAAERHRARARGYGPDGGGKT